MVSDQDAPLSIDTYDEKGRIAHENEKGDELAKREVLQLGLPGRVREFSASVMGRN